jgi:hypothetical protein
MSWAASGARSKAQKQRRARRRPIPCARLCIRAIALPASRSVVLARPARSLNATVGCSRRAGCGRRRQRARLPSRGPSARAGFGVLPFFSALAVAAAPGLASPRCAPPSARGQKCILLAAARRCPRAGLRAFLRWDARSPSGGRCRPKQARSRFHRGCGSCRGQRAAAIARCGGKTILYHQLSGPAIARRAAARNPVEEAGRPVAQPLDLIARARLATNPAGEEGRAALSLSARVAQSRSRRRTATTRSGPRSCTNHHRLWPMQPGRSVACVCVKGGP